MIEREEMQEVVRRYKEPICLILGSHSALDKIQAARNFGLRRIVYTTPARAIIYLSNPIVGKENENIEDLPTLTKRDVIVRFDPKDIPKNGDWKEAILVLDNYSDIVKYVDDLINLECIHPTDRAFSTYVGGDEKCSKIEKEFAVPIVGSRKLLKIENRGEVERDYYWFAEQAGIPTPKSYKGKYEITNSGIKFKEFIDEPMLLKAEHAQRQLEREFIWAVDSQDMEEQVEKKLSSGELSIESLKHARLEQIVLGPHANINFFFSPLYAQEDWGESEEAFQKIYGVDKKTARIFLANEFISIDERRETVWDGIRRMPIDIQQKLKEKEREGKFKSTFEVTLHSMLSIRESLIKDALNCANAFLLACLKYEPPGIIGPWCLQTIITWDKVSKYNYKPVLKFDATLGDVPKTAADYGLYDVSEKAKDIEMHIFVTQDVAVRHGGGANVHMGVGAQYSNAKYKRIMSLGDRTALEIRNAIKKKKLEELVT